MPAPPHDASGHTWHHPDSVLFRITKFGPAAYPEGFQTDMPAFEKTLSDSQIAAILAYIKSTWPPEVQRRQNRMNERR
jgi:mono/diheme cytochrome c family protein